MEVYLFFHVILNDRYLMVSALFFEDISFSMERLVKTIS